MSFTVKIKASDHRVNTGAIEDAIKGTFAEVLSEAVEVYVNQFDDHTLCITVERNGSIDGDLDGGSGLVGDPQ